MKPGDKKMNKSVSKPSWFDLNNYTDLETNHTGLTILARLLYIRAGLFDAVSQCGNDVHYQQIIDGDPLFNSGRLRVISPPVARPSVTAQSGHGLISNFKMLSEIFSIPLQELSLSQMEELGIMDMDVNPVLQKENPNHWINLKANLKAPTQKLLKDVDLHPKLIHYPRIFASNFDPCSCRQAPSLLYQAGLAITASPGSNLNANQHRCGLTEIFVDLCS